MVLVSLFAWYIFWVKLWFCSVSDESGFAAVLLLIMCCIFAWGCVFSARALSFNHCLHCLCVIPSSECTLTHSIVQILVSRPLWRSHEVHWARAVLVQLAAWWVPGTLSVTPCARIIPAADPSLLVLNHNGSNSKRCLRHSEGCDSFVLITAHSSSLFHCVYSTGLEGENKIAAHETSCRSATS